MSQSKNLARLAVGALLLGGSFRSSSIGVVAAWPALACLLYGWRQIPLLRVGFPAAWLALYTGLAIGHLGHWPFRGPTYFAVVAMTTLVSFVPFAVDRRIRRGLVGWPSTLGFPLAWVAVEFLTSRAPGGPQTWGAIGYTQYGNLPLMQLASVTGIWGIGFLVTWVASVASWAAGRAPAARELRGPVLACGAVVSLVLLAGGVRLALAPRSPRSIRVAAVTLPPNLFGPGEMFRIADGRVPAQTVADKLQRLHEWFFSHTEREAIAGAQVVAWPEMNFLVPAQEEAAAIERARQLSARYHFHLAMALGTVTPGTAHPFENKEVLIGPDGAVIYSYLKNRPVAGWEASVMRTGDGRVAMADTTIGRISSAICFDNDAPEFVRQIGSGRADLWILPANDWEAVGELHFEMAAFRAIENGTPILRAAATGISGVFDARGRVLAATDHLAGASTMAASLPLGGVPTVYARIGDLFAWACVLGSVLMTVASAWRARSTAALWRISPSASA